MEITESQYSQFLLMREYLQKRFTIEENNQYVSIYKKRSNTLVGVLYVRPNHFKLCTPKDGDFYLETVKHLSVILR